MLLPPPSSSFSAPGKLFLFGEYAVLAGGWSLVGAVSRRVYAVRRAHAGQYQVIGLSAADASKGLVDAVIAQCAAPSGLEPGHFECDVRAFMADGKKLGLGSSAASAVALSAACLSSSYRAHSTSINPDKTFRCAFEAHRLFQSGRGSGADVAASTYGGLLGYRLGPTRTSLVEVGSAQPQRFDSQVSPITGVQLVQNLRLPEGIVIRPVWLGKPAVSTRMMEKIEVAQNRYPDTMRELLKQIADVSFAALQSCITNSAEAFLDAVSLGDQAMGALGQLAEAPIIVDSHRMLRKIAVRHGAVVKPSGAGGGDFSLLVGPVDADWPAIEQAVMPTQKMYSPLVFSPEGVREERGD